ncbi:MAG: hypothetical protein LBH93_00705, partial [Chitinispirillales bacterium]|nr:hypothetical protein [Chitinispirillales bacterium]
MSIVSKFLSKCVVAAAVFVGAAVGQTPNTAWYTNNAAAASFNISTADELAGLAALVNRSSSPVSFAGKTVKLAASIDLSGYKSGNGWTPIGAEASAFKGVFDGNGKKISGLYIDDITRSYAGLFGHIGSGAEIKNLGVVGVNVNGGVLVGALVGRVGDSAKVAQCYTTGTVNGSNYVGGLVGHLRSGSRKSAVSNCYSTCAVTGTSRVGGIAGEVDTSYLQRCAALNPSVKGTEYVGRVVGRNLGSVANLAGNAAFSAIINNVGNTTWGTNGDATANGAAITGVDIQSSGTLNGTFTSADGWAIRDGSLPGFGAAEAMPEHLKPIDAIAPPIIVPPASTTVGRGDAAIRNLTVKVGSSSKLGTLSYQWYTAKSANSNEDGTAISGANSSVYAAPANVLGKFYYYVVVTNTIADNNDGGKKSATRTSDVVTVTVAIFAQGPSTILIQADTTIVYNPTPDGAQKSLSLNATFTRGTVGATLDLSIEAVSTDGGQLAYEWYTRQPASRILIAPIDGETGATYAAPIDSEGEFYYAVIVNNTIADNKDGGEKTSSITHYFTLESAVSARAPIIIPLASSTIEDGAKRCLTATAVSPDDGELKYQWYTSTDRSNVNGSKVSDANSATFCVPADTQDEIYYYVEVTNTIPNN